MKTEISQLQEALIKAAKVGHISLMREFIEMGGDPLAKDEEGISAIEYAEKIIPEETAKLIKEISKLESLKEEIK